MVCNAACNLFLNNSEIRVKQILWPQTLPHSPPIFLWVTCGAAGKPMLFLSLHGRAGSTSLHVSGQGRLFIFHKKVDLIFSKRFEKQQMPAHSLHTKFVAITHLLTCPSTLPQHVLPAGLCAADSRSFTCLGGTSIT